MGNLFYYRLIKEYKLGTNLCIMAMELFLINGYGIILG